MTDPPVSTIYIILARRDHHSRAMIFEDWTFEGRSVVFKPRFTKANPLGDGGQDMTLLLNSFDGAGTAKSILLSPRNLKALR